jgi:tetratricopeptide (TPR) repeat protein
MLVLALGAPLAAVPSDAQRDPRAGIPDVSCPGSPRIARGLAQVRDALDRAAVEQGAPRERHLADALALARAAMVTDSANPFHAFVLAEAAAAAGEPREAAAALRRAVALCPALEDGARLVRQQGYSVAVAAGVDAYRAGDTGAATAAWEGAAELHPGGADAHYNLGIVHAQQGDAATALERYRAALAASAPGGSSLDAHALRRHVLLAMQGVAAALFRGERFAEAAGVFEEVLTAAPEDRNARYNRTQALYQLRRWDEVVTEATRVVELDPLNHNAWLLLHGAHRELAEQARLRGDAGQEQAQSAMAERALGAGDALPVRLTAVDLAGDHATATLSGRVSGGVADPGRTLDLEITLTDGRTPVGTGTASITVPPEGEERAFSLVIEVAAPALSFRYRVRD